MTDYVMMPAKEYRNICAAVREKTGGTTLLRSGELAEKISEISAEGSQETFWDAFQSNGTATNYQNAFRSKWWNDEIFCPKYPFVCRGVYGAYNMFNGASNITTTKVPIEVYNGELNGTFGSCSALETIPFLKLENVTTYSGAFSGCKKLTNITIDGSIDVSISMAATDMLSAKSVQSVIDHLKDLTGLTTQTLTFHNEVGGRLTEAQKAEITGKNWTLAY